MQECERPVCYPPLPSLSLPLCGQARADRDAVEDLCFELGEFRDMTSECLAMQSILQSHVGALERAEGPRGAEREDGVEGVAGGLCNHRSLKNMSPAGSNCVTSGDTGVASIASEGLPAGVESLADDLFSTIFSEQERELLDDVV